MSLNSSSNKVLVTGGAGFIGSELTRQLVSAGYKVIVVDNLTNGKLANLEQVDSTLCQIEVADIRDERKIQSLLKGVSIVYHLACLGVRHSIHAPQENHEVNASATLNLLRMAREAAVARFVYVSSSEVYGTAITAPMTENHPTFPMTVYGAAKLAGECYTRAYHRTYNYPTVVVRPFNAYGPRSHHEGDSGEVIPKFLLRCMAQKPLIIFGDGNQTRDFTFVSDTARGILQAGQCSAAIGETINLGYGREISISELAQIVKDVVAAPHAEVSYDQGRPGDVLRLYADTSKAQKLLSFKTSIDLKTGLTHLKQWYDQQGVSASELLKNESVHNWVVDKSTAPMSAPRAI